jgi:hypothetical protein
LVNHIRFFSVYKRLLSDQLQVFTLLTHNLDVNQAIKFILDGLRFTCGYIQTEMVERSERLVKFVDLLQEHDLCFILGTDDQGSELTSLFREQAHFIQLMSWCYKDNIEAEFVNNSLKSNTIECIKYTLGALTLQNK